MKAVFTPFRQLFAVIGEIGKAIGDAIGVDATATLFNLEQGWKGIKEAVSDASEEAIFFAKVVGGVIGKVVVAVAKTANGIKETVSGVVQTVVSTIQQAIENLLNIIPEPIKKILGGLELPKLNLDIELPKLPNPFKGLLEKANELKESVIEFSGVEKTITDENNKQVDAKNKIVDLNRENKKTVEQLSEAEKKARQEAEQLEKTFFKIGESVKSDLVGGLRDAINGSKTFGQAISGVLNNLKNKLIDLALDKAISGIGGALSGGKGFGGFLGGLFGGKKERGGRVSAGGAFLVGERGPEILQMGSKGGNIIPNSQIGGGGDSVVNNISVSVDASGSAVSGSSAEGNELGQQIAVAIQSELIKQKRAGGLLA